MLRKIAALFLVSTAANAVQYVTPEYPYGSGSCQYNGDGTSSSCAAGAGQAGAINGLDNVTWTAGNTYVLVGTHVVTPVIGANDVTLDCASGCKLYSTNHFKLNNESDAVYFLNGYGHDPSLAPFRNGRFTDIVGVATDLLGWGETLGTAAVITQDTTTVQSGEYASAQLQNGSAGPTRLSQNVNVTNAQLYEFSYYCKSDGAASLAVQFNHASEGLDDATNGAGEYGTWNVAGGDNIAALACATTDTDWTKKTVKLRGDGSNHTPNLRFIVSGANGSKAYVSRAIFKPLWTNSSGNIWTTGLSGTNSSSNYTFLLKGSIFQLQAASAAVSSDAIWYLDNISTDHKILYLYSPEGDPSGDSYTGGDIWVTGATTGSAVDVNDKTGVTIQNLDILVGGYYTFKNLGNNTTIQNVTAKLGNGFLEPGARTGNVYDGNSFQYGDWLFNFSGCSSCTITNNTIEYGLAFSGVSNEGGGMSYDSTGADTDNNTIRGNTSRHSKYGFASHGATVNPSTGNVWDGNIAEYVSIGFWAQDEANGDTDAVWRNNIARNLTKATASIGSCVSAGQSIGLLQYRTGNSVEWISNQVSGATAGIMLGITADAASFTNNDIHATVAYVDMCNMSAGAFNTTGFTTNTYRKANGAVWEYVDGGGAQSTSSFASWQALSKDAAGQHIPRNVLKPYQKSRRE